MDRLAIEEVFARVDTHLDAPCYLWVYGAAAFILMGVEGRSSLDIDVASPYCEGDIQKLKQAFILAGVPVNPPPHEAGSHVEWVGVERLSLPLPDDNGVTLWRGHWLTVKTVAPAALIASKLIRYDEIDQADIRSLAFRMRVTWDQVREAAERLPLAFREDSLVKENLMNLKQDLELWSRP